jgi:hypothetical protein
MREPGDLDRGTVGVGSVRVGHRLNDDRVGPTDQDTADVDADRRSATGTRDRPIGH